MEGVRRVMVLLGSKEGGGSMSQQKVLSESRFILSLCLVRIVYIPQKSADPFQYMIMPQ